MIIQTRVAIWKQVWVVGLSVQDGHSRKDSRLKWFRQNQGTAAWILVFLGTVTLVVLVVEQCSGSGGISGVGFTPVVVAPLPSPPPEPASPTATYPPLPTSTPIPIPNLEVRRLGMGSPDLPLRLGLEIVNFAPYPVTLWGVMHDIDTHQNQLYKAGRADIDGNGGRGEISFAGWFPGACYVPVLLMARTPQGLEQLESWFEEGSGTTRPYPGIIATGDICVVHTESEPVCVPAQPTDTAGSR
jgi:hypothetical protein